MRTNIDIDDGLMAEAMRRTDLKTKKAVVEEALRRLIQLEKQKDIRELFGTVRWEGDLDELRQMRTFGEDDEDKQG